MNDTKAFYDKTAASWAESGYGEDSVPSLLEYAKGFPAGSRFLDLCCGCRYDSARVHALGYDVVGIDFSEESLKIARERNPGITFLGKDLLNDYSCIGEVNAVFVIAGLVHVEPEKLRQAFQRMAAVVKSGGGLFMTVWEGEGKIERMSLRVVDGETYDRRFFGHTLDELKDAARGLFTFVREVGRDGTPWRNYIFSRD